MSDKDNFSYFAFKKSTNQLKDLTLNSDKEFISSSNSLVAEEAAAALWPGVCKFCGMVAPLLSVDGADLLVAEAGLICS